MVKWRLLRCNSDVHDVVSELIAFAVGAGLELGPSTTWFSLSGE